MSFSRRQRSGNIRSELRHDDHRRARSLRPRWAISVSDDTMRILDLLRDAGVTTIDTADVYSSGGAEEILGQALEGRRDEFVLVTKAFQPMFPGPHGTGLSRKYLISACEASLRRLRTDYIDLYICHEPDMLVPLDETLRAYEDLVSSGKVRYIGCSNHSAWHVMKALAASDRIGAPRYICQQVNYSLVSRDVEHEIVPLAADQKAGLMVWSPLHAGLLTGKFRRDTPRPAVARLNELDVPGTVDFDRLYRIVDVLDAIAARARRLDPAGRDQLGAAQAVRRHGDPRRAQRRATARHPRAPPTGGSRPRSRPGSTRSAPCRSLIRSGTSTSSASAGTRLPNMGADRTPPVQ